MTYKDAAKGLTLSDVANLRAIVKSCPIPALVSEKEIMTADLDKLSGAFDAYAARLQKAEDAYLQAVKHRPSYAPTDKMTKTEDDTLRAVLMARRELRLYAAVLLLKTAGKSIPEANDRGYGQISKDRRDFYTSPIA